MDSLTQWSIVSTLPVLGVLIGIAAFVAYKVRRVHLQLYEIDSRLEETRRETLTLFKQVHAMLALERRLDLPQALPPMRGWAGSPDFLLEVANRILASKPSQVWECGSGVSTLVAARCAQLNQVGHVITLEHEPQHAAKTRALLSKYRVEAWATVLDAPLSRGHDGSLWYALDSASSLIAPVDLLVVDGPPSAVAPLARYPALRRMIDYMASDAVVLMDDADRSDEREILRRWAEEFPEFKQTKCDCEKGCVVLTRNAGVV